MRIGVVCSTLGYLLLAIGLAMVFPLVVALIYGEGDAPAFVYGVLVTVAVGLGLVFFFRVPRTEIRAKEGYLIVTSSWVGMSLFGALPFVLSGAIENPVDAVFESMSGFTTTGASILTDIESLPHGVLFWRSMTHWIGGMGIIVLTVAILPFLGVGGMSLAKAELPGPVTDKLTPRMVETARILWGVYVLLSALEVILLLWGGMSLYDSLCHTFGTVATGGFSTKNASIGAYSSPYIQYVIVVFMALAGTNFTLHFHALRGRVGSYWKSGEFVLYFGATLFVVCVIMGELILVQEKNTELAFREAAFQAVSITTTTGYATSDYGTWSSLSQFLLLSLMVMGGMAGSTAGGIKVMRFQLLFQHVRLELRKLLHPQAILRVRLGDRVVADNIVSMVLSFMMIYALLVFAGTAVMTLMGMDLVSAGTAVVACLSNIGPGLGAVGPAENFSGVHPWGKVALTFLMLVGRLELYTVLVIFSRGYWRA